MKDRDEEPETARDLVESIRRARRLVERLTCQQCGEAFFAGEKCAACGAPRAEARS